MPESSELGELIKHRMGQHWSILLDGLMVVAGSSDVGVEHRNACRLAAAARPGDRACCRGSSAPSRRSACRSRRARIAAASTRSAPGTGAPGARCQGRSGSPARDAVPTLQDQFAQGDCRRTDRGRLVANAFDGPIGVAPVARRHVIGDGGVVVIAAGAQMRRRHARLSGRSRRYAASAEPRLRCERSGRASPGKSEPRTSTW